MIYKSLINIRKKVIKRAEPSRIPLLINLDAEWWLFTTATNRIIRMKLETTIEIYSIVSVILKLCVHSFLINLAA